MDNQNNNVYCSNGFEQQNNQMNMSYNNSQYYATGNNSYDINGYGGIPQQSNNVYGNMPPLYGGGFGDSDYVNRLNSINFNDGIGNDNSQSMVGYEDSLSHKKVRKGPTGIISTLLTKGVTFIADKLLGFAVIATIAMSVFLTIKNELYEVYGGVVIYGILLVVIAISALYGVIQYNALYKKGEKFYHVGWKLIPFTTFSMFFDGGKAFEGYLVMLLVITILALYIINAVVYGVKENLVKVIFADFAVGFSLTYIVGYILIILTLLFAVLLLVAYPVLYFSSYKIVTGNRGKTLNGIKEFLEKLI